MTQLVTLLAAFLLITGLAALVLLVIVLRTRQVERMNARGLSGTGPASTDPVSAPADGRGHPEGESPASSYAIVKHLGRIQRANKKQLFELMAAITESGDWRALGKQFDTLFDKRLAHLRALTKRNSAVLPIGKTLRHTIEAYRLSRLILDLYERFVAPSELVTSTLDEWFRVSRNLSMTEFVSRIHLDCARILLLNLDYAQPLQKTAMEQLDMAETYCSAANLPESDAAAQTLLAEIALRRERLSARPSQRIFST